MTFGAFVLWNGSVVLGKSAILCSLMGICLSCVLFLSLPPPPPLLLFVFIFYNLVVMKCLPLILSLDISGAKEAHTVSPHFARIMYFRLIASLAMAPCISV